MLMRKSSGNNSNEFACLMSDIKCIRISTYIFLFFLYFIVEEE